MLFLLLFFFCNSLYSQTTDTTFFQNYEMINDDCFNDTIQIKLIDSRFKTIDKIYWGKIDTNVCNTFFDSLKRVTNFIYPNLQNLNVDLICFDFDFDTRKDFYFQLVGQKRIVDSTDTTYQIYNKKFILYNNDSLYKTNYIYIDSIIYDINNTLVTLIDTIGSNHFVNTPNTLETGLSIKKYKTLTISPMISSVKNKEDIFKVFPNPTDGLIYVETKTKVLDDLFYKVFRLNGQIVKEEKLYSPIQQINLNDCENGVYLLEIFDNKTNLQFQFKIIKFN